VVDEAKNPSDERELSPRPALVYPALDGEPRGFTEAEWVQIVEANHARLEKKL